MIPGFTAVTLMHHQIHRLAEAPELQALLDPPLASPHSFVYHIHQTVEQVLLRKGLNLWITFYEIIGLVQLHQCQMVANICN